MTEAGNSITLATGNCVTSIREIGHDNRTGSASVHSQLGLFTVAGKAESPPAAPSFHAKIVSFDTAFQKVSHPFADNPCWRLSTIGLWSASLRIEPETTRGDPMSGEKKASCQCGQLEVVVPGEPDIVTACNCLACQKRTGAVFLNRGILSARKGCSFRTVKDL